MKPGTKAANNTEKKKRIRSTLLPQLHFQQEAANCVMIFTVCALTFTKYHSADQINGDDMGGGGGFVRMGKNRKGFGTQT